MLQKFMDDREERAAKLEAKWETARAEKMDELRELREEAKRKVSKLRRTCILFRDLVM